MSNTQQKPKIPIIMYEEEVGGKTNLIPYIEVGLNDEMPKVIFISEYKDTGELEPGPDGPSKVVDMMIHQYVDMDQLKKRLDPKTYDKIRMALGMQPLKDASKKGEKILNKVFMNAENNKKELETNQDKRSQRTFELGEGLKEKMKNLMIEANKKDKK